MKTLILMRHAKSSWGYEVRDDWDRSLNKHGKKHVMELSKIFLEKNLAPQVILASAASRARETCELLISAIQYRGDIHYLSSLYLGETEDYVSAIRSVSDRVDCALVIGHNPGLQTLYQRLSWNIEALRSSTIALIEIPIDSWKDLTLDCPSEGAAIWESNNQLAEVTI